MHSSEVGGLSLVPTQIQMVLRLRRVSLLHSIPDLFVRLFLWSMFSSGSTLHGAWDLSKSKEGSLPALPTVFQINRLMSYKPKASMNKCCVNLGYGGHREPPVEI